MGRGRVDERVVLVKAAALYLRTLLLLVHHLEVFRDHHDLGLSDDDKVREITIPHDLFNSSCLG